MLRTLPALLVLSLLACPGPSAVAPLADGGGGDDAGAAADAGALTASGYCEATAGFFCDFYLRCGRMLAANRDECLAVFAESCEARYEPRYVDLEDAGLLSLSAPGVEACRAHLASVQCDQQFQDLMGPCIAMWQGRQPAGAACGLDVESFTCAPGTACQLGLNLCGTCKVTAPLGGACGDGGVCGNDAACVQGLCVRRRHIGETCSATLPCEVGASCPGTTCVGPQFVGEGEVCNQARRCPYRSTCIGGACVRSGLQGEACTARACATGRCVTEGSAKVCRPFLAPGEACASSMDCRSAHCVQGTCQPLPDACFP